MGINNSAFCSMTLLAFKWGVLLSVRHLLYASLGSSQKVLLCYIKVAISLSGFLLLAWRGTVASSAG